MLVRHALLLGLLLVPLGHSTSGAVTATSGSLSCQQVTLGSESATKWTVSCSPTNTVGSSSATFDPAVVKNFYVNSEPYVAATASNDLNLSSTFSAVDELISSSVTTFSLSAAAGYTPNVPVTVKSTAFAELSSLQTLNVQGIPLAGGDLHLVLPRSIQNISLAGCSLSNVSFEFVDGSSIADSAITSIDLSHNSLKEVPAMVYSFPSDISTIDLRGNDLIDLSTESTDHEQELTKWINAKVVQFDSVTLSGLKTPKQASNSTKSNQDGPTSSSTPSRSSATSGSDGTTAANAGSSSMHIIPITIIGIVVPGVCAVGIALAFIVRNRRRTQERDSEGILDLPHHFDRHSYGKQHRERLESSGQFTAADSELSHSRISPNQEGDDGGSNRALSVTPSNVYGQSSQQQAASTSANVNYVNLESPQDAKSNFSMTNSKRRLSKQDDEDRGHSIELLKTHSTSSPSALRTRLGARKALRKGLETLLTSQSAEGSFTASLLTVKTRQYSVRHGTKIDETPLAFFVDCRLVAHEDSTEAALDPTASRLVLKFFIESDADLAGRESYALSCLQHDESTRAVVPRLFDEALEYELDSGDGMKLSCCVLVLEMPSCTTLHSQLAAFREHLPQQISRVLSALHALHSRGLVHGALHTDSLVVCSPDARLKFWGLEHVSRAGHMVPCPDAEHLDLCQAECAAPEVASVTLGYKPSPRASPSLDVWSLGVMILKAYAAGKRLEEFQDCEKPRDVFESLDAPDSNSSCFFDKSIAAFVPNEDLQTLLQQCLQQDPLSRPSVEAMLKHKVFVAKEREITRRTRVKSAKVTRLLSAIAEEKETAANVEPEREASGKDQYSVQSDDKEVKEDVTKAEDVVLEPLPPSLWLFFPPPELDLDLIQRASFYSVSQWVTKLKYCQQQKAEDLRFPLVFMCEACDFDITTPCSTASTTKFGVSVPASLLPLVMPLVRETMLFLEARAIMSNGLSVGEASGLAGAQQWEELRTFYRALERMELATLNPANEVMFAPMEEQLQSRDPSKAQQVLDELKSVVFSEEKREYVRNLLNALVIDEEMEARAERTSWAKLRRCSVPDDISTTPDPTRWLCSHHAVGNSM